MGLYQTITKEDTNYNAQGGYKALVYFAPASDFTTINQPSNNAAVGDAVSVFTADTFPSGKGYMQLPAKMHSVTSKTTSTGDDGAQSLVHEFEAIVLGDSIIHLDTFQNMLNDQCVFLLQDQNCNFGTYIRFGDNCLTPVMKVTFDGKTTKEGMKEYKITGTIKGHKVFYSGTIVTI
jgi:hypothetical protein